MLKVKSSRFVVKGLGLEVWGLRFEIQNSRSWVQGLGFRV
jgi:hypothetical protein